MTLWPSSVPASAGLSSTHTAHQPTTHSQFDKGNEDDDQVMEVFTMVKDDILMVVEMEDSHDGRVWGPRDGAVHSAHTIA